MPQARGARYTRSRLRYLVYGHVTSHQEVYDLERHAKTAAGVVRDHAFECVRVMYFVLRNFLISIAIGGRGSLCTV